MSDLVLRGAALRAAVRLAESPATGGIVRSRFVSDLGLDELFALDLREQDPEPASMPLHPPIEHDGTSSDRG